MWSLRLRLTVKQSRGRSKLVRKQILEKSPVASCRTPAEPNQKDWGCHPGSTGHVRPRMRNNDRRCGLSLVRPGCFVPTTETTLYLVDDVQTKNVFTNHKLDFIIEFCFFLCKPLVTMCWNSWELADVFGLRFSQAGKFLPYLVYFCFRCILFNFQINVFISLVFWFNYICLYLISTCLEIFFSLFTSGNVTESEESLSAAKRQSLISIERIADGLKEKSETGAC